MHRWASRLASSRSAARAASIDVAESGGRKIPRLELAGGAFRGIDQFRVTEPGHERFGSRARPTPGHAKGRAILRRAKGRAFPSRAKGGGGPESRLAGVGYWMRALRRVRLLSSR